MIIQQKVVPGIMLGPEEDKSESNYENSNFLEFID